VPTQKQPDLENEPSASEQGSRTSKRGTLFDDGMGDYRILAIRSDEAMTFIPDVPGFLNHRTALAYIRNAGEQFSNMQLAVVRFCDFVAPVAHTEVTMELSFKPRRSGE
jgi:hypothetical protein